MFTDSPPPMFSPPLLRQVALSACRDYYRDVASMQSEALRDGARWAASPMSPQGWYAVDAVAVALEPWHELPGAEGGFAAGLAVDLPWPRNWSFTTEADRYTAELIQVLVHGVADSVVPLKSTGRHAVRDRQESTPCPPVTMPAPAHAGVALAVGTMKTQVKARIRERLVGSGVEMVPTLAAAVPHVCDMAGLATARGVRVLVVITARHYRPDADTTRSLEALHASGLPIVALLLDDSGGADDEDVRTSVEAGAIRPVSAALVLDPTALIPGTDIAHALMRAISA